MLTGVVIVWLTGRQPASTLWVLAVLCLLTAVCIAWFTQAWPAAEYRRTSYLLDPDGIEIRSGVIWRAVTSVPRSRVQHIDVAQGPLERSYGLARLIIYTAGTDHSRVELAGLNHSVALELRQYLLPRGSDDAV
jgi:membrane protein YdbS with pleckstrin-like domain